MDDRMGTIYLHRLNKTDGLTYPKLATYKSSLKSDKGQSN